MKARRVLEEGRVRGFPGPQVLVPQSLGPRVHSCGVTRFMWLPARRSIRRERYGSTVTPRQNATWPVILRAGGQGRS
jgi:hypothetical protein